MCTIDIAILPQVWIQPEGLAHPEAYDDFNTQHVCRNFESVIAWAEEHQIAEHVPEDFLESPQPGDKIYSILP